MKKVIVSLFLLVFSSGIMHGAMTPMSGAFSGLSRANESAVALGRPTDVIAAIARDFARDAELERRKMVADVLVEDLKAELLESDDQQAKDWILAEKNIKKLGWPEEIALPRLGAATEKNCNKIFDFLRQPERMSYKHVHQSISYLIENRSKSVPFSQFMLLYFVEQLSIYAETDSSAQFLPILKDVIRIYETLSSEDESVVVQRAVYKQMSKKESRYYGIIRTISQKKMLTVGEAFTYVAKLVHIKKDLEARVVPAWVQFGNGLFA